MRARFQYLMQILQAQYRDYVPRYQILMFDDTKIYGPCLQWQEPSTIWEGTPVMGFMAETFLDDLPSLSFKDFNPMWTYPTTAVYKCWDALTFGMPPWHIAPNNEHTAKFAKDALQSQSPIAAFKSTNMLHALGIVHSKIILPSGDTKGEEKKRTYCPTTWSHLLHMGICSRICGSIETGKGNSIVVQRDDTSSSYSIEQQEPVSSSMRVCRLCQHSHVRSYDQFDSMHRSKDLQGL